MEVKQRVYEKVIERVNSKIDVLHEAKNNIEHDVSSLKMLIQEEMKLKFLQDRMMAVK